MNTLGDFINSSSTFNGFTFSGCYDMPKNIFLQLYSHFLNTGENYLDVYSYLQYALWEKKEDKDYMQDYEWCNMMHKYVSIGRNMKLMNFEELKEIRQYINECNKRYTDYLDHQRNEPRRNACKFTALQEVKDYIFAVYGKKCLKCGSVEKISLDHIVPIQKGGKDEIENLQPLCKSCNSSKGISIVDYRPKLK